MNPAYLKGVLQMPSGTFRDIKVIGSGNNVWYAGDYKVVTDNSFSAVKKEIIKITNKYNNLSTADKDWHWHHVVETNHLEKILFKGDIEKERKEDMPTVLIYRTEHTFFNSNFRNAEFKELTHTLPGMLKQTPDQELKTFEGRERLRKRIKAYKAMYGNAYIGHPTLLQIANNVFNQLLVRLP